MSVVFGWLSCCTGWTGGCRFFGENLMRVVLQTLDRTLHHLMVVRTKQKERHGCGSCRYCGRQGGVLPLHCVPGGPWCTY